MPPSSRPQINRGEHRQGVPYLLAAGFGQRSAEFLAVGLIELRGEVLSYDPVDRQPSPESPEGCIRAKLHHGAHAFERIQGEESFDGGPFPAKNGWNQSSSIWICFAQT